MDALSIASRSNQGQASVLSRGNQEEFGKMIIGERMRQLKEQQAKDAEIKSLLSDEVKSKWTSDNINYFQPKIEELRKKTIDLYKQKNGKLSDIDIFELKQNWAKLKNEAEISNALYAEEQDRIKALNEDPEFKKFDEDSLRIRSVWNNPQEMFGKEIEEAGGIIPWRAKNSQAFQNIGAYSLEEHLQDTLKDKNSKWFIRDEKGKVKSYTDPKTGLVVSEFREGIDPNKLSQHVSTIWNDPKDWKAKRMRSTAMGWVEQNFDVDELGNVIPKSDQAMMVQSQAPSLKGLKPEQVKAVLGKQYIVEEAKVRFPSKEGIMTEKPININTGSGSGSGGGGDTPNKFKWALGIQNQSPYKSITVTQDVAQKLASSSAAGRKIMEEQGIEGLQKIADNVYDKAMKKYAEVPYVSVSFKGGKDNPRLTYQGKQYVSNGFGRKPNGNWYMVGTEELSSGNSFAELLKFVSDPEAYKKEDSKVSKKELGVAEIPLNADIAVKHGFTGVNAIPNMIKFLNSQVPQDF